MSKETQTNKQPAAAVATAPMFTLARSLLAEMDQQTRRWIEYSTAQAAETVKLTEAMRAQGMAAVQAMLAGVEESAGRGFDGTSPFTIPFHFGPA